VNFWSFHAGDEFKAGERLCEISLPSVTLGIDAPEGGIMAKILCDKYETAQAGSTIAMYALSQEHYLDFLANAM
jgi:pyruvate/2-oxoglutarate dehydrogenase complex dihydrolipoamide acyltransferase (E2) component